MQPLGKSEFCSLIQKELEAKNRAFYWMRNSLVGISTSIASLAIAHSESYSGLQHELAIAFEDVAYLGMCSVVGTTILAGIHSSIYVARADKVQAKQASQFAPLIQSDLGQELRRLEDLILPEYGIEPTED